MDKFFIGQAVTVKKTASHSVGCKGEVVNVDDSTCEVRITENEQRFTQTFDKDDLTSGSTVLVIRNPETVIEHSLSRMLREFKKNPALAH